MEQNDKERIELITQTASQQISADFCLHALEKRDYGIGLGKHTHGISIDSPLARLLNDGFRYEPTKGGYHLKIFFCDVSQIDAVNKDVLRTVLNDLKIPISPRVKSSVFSFAKNAERLAIGVELEISKNADTTGGGVTRYIFRNENPYNTVQIDEFLAAGTDQQFISFLKAFERARSRVVNIHEPESGSLAVKFNESMKAIANHMVGKSSADQKLDIIYEYDGSDGLPRYGLTPKLNKKRGSYYAPITDGLNNVVAYVNQNILVGRSKAAPTVSKDDMRQFVERLNAEIDKCNGDIRQYKTLIRGSIGKEKTSIFPNVETDYTLANMLPKSHVYRIARENPGARYEPGSTNIDMIMDKGDFRKDFYPFILLNLARDKAFVEGKHFTTSAIIESQNFSVHLFNSISDDLPFSFRGKEVKTTYSRGGDGGVEISYNLELAMREGICARSEPDKNRSLEEAAQSILLNLVERTVINKRKISLDAAAGIQPVNGDPAHMLAPDTLRNVYFTSGKMAEKYSDLTATLEELKHMKPKDVLLELVKKYDLKLTESDFQNNNSEHKDIVKIRLEGDGFGAEGLSTSASALHGQDPKLLDQAYKKMIHHVKHFAVMAADRSPSVPGLTA